MEETPSKPGLDIDTRVLSDFIYTLNTARRQVLAYPSGHPVVAAAAEKLISQLPQLLEFRNEITIGIARDILMVGDQALDNTNPIYSDLANNLFDAQVASLSISREVEASDICQFFEILRYKPEDLASRGGLHRVMALAEIKGLKAQGIDFSAFHATEVDQVHAPKSSLIEEETTVLWKSFVSGLVAGTLDPDGEKFAAGATLDPQLLAEVMNREASDGGQELAGSYEEAITGFLKQTDRSQLQSKACQETMGRLGDLVASLKPELRRRFLNSTLKSCSDRQDVAAELLGHLPQAQILEAMEQVGSDSLEVPQTLMDVLGKLAQESRPEGRTSLVSGKREHSPGETAELLGQLFSADKSDRFVPADYQDALAVLAAAEALPGLERAHVEELIDSLEGHAVEKSFCSVMIDLLDRGTKDITTLAISRNMQDLVHYFLEVGDFSSLSSVHDHLLRHSHHVESLLDSPDKSALRLYEGEEFVEQVLDGLDTWGKPQHAAIKGLIKRVGPSFADPLLDRLAEEPTMSRRRLLMECLQVIRVGAIPQMVARLHDRRWFFVRNLVILLRGVDDATVLKPLGRLVGYAHPKVQFEVMRTFLYYKDPRADRYLLKELDSKDPDVLLNAARLAANSRSGDVAERLAEILSMKLSGESEEGVKKTVIKSMGEMACPEALPGIKTFLGSRSVLKSMQLNRLKVELVKTLPKYSDPLAAELAEEVYLKASGELARVAGEVCLKLKGKLPWT